MLGDSDQPSMTPAPPGREYNYIPEAYGQQGSSAVKVTFRVLALLFLKDSAFRITFPKLNPAKSWKGILSPYIQYIAS